MKFINLNFIFNLATLFIILLISFSSNSLQLPEPQLCEDQGEYVNDENTSLYCVVCNTDYNKDAFLELYDDNKKIYLEDIEYEIKFFAKSEIEKDRTIKFCKTGDVIPIGTVYIAPEPELTLDPEPEIEFTDEDQSTNNENNENDPPVRSPATNSSEETNAKSQIQDDLNKIIQIVDLYKTIEENISFLSFNSRDNTRSFVERYVEIIEKMDILDQ